jgi:hypothetical protein
MMAFDSWADLSIYLFYPRFGKRRNHKQIKSPPLFPNHRTIGGPFRWEYFEFFYNNNFLDLPEAQDS